MNDSADARPAALGADRSFHGFTATQFLGAFNDNAFKQLILLLAVDAASPGEGASLQPLAMGLFSVPFVLFSGVAGNLADKASKTRVIYWMKVLEFVVMVLGMFAFWLRSIPFLMATLFLMGTQSAFFGPAKYGILPEMLRARNLSKANGVVQMTTFMAIILGTATGGGLRDLFPDDLWIPGAIFSALALIGTGTSLLVRKIPPARPDLPLVRALDDPAITRWLRFLPGSAQALGLTGDLLPTIGRIFRDRPLLIVMLVYSFFWFIGGIVVPTMNLYGRSEDLLALDNTQTSLLLVSMSIGMAAGFMLGGLLSGGKINLDLTNWGMIGVVACLGALFFLHQPERLYLTHGALFFLGASSGLFALPLQTFIQVRPPEGEKGRVIGAMNFINFIFIFASAGFQWLAERFLPAPWIPLSLGILLALVGIPAYPYIRKLAAEI